MERDMRQEWETPDDFFDVVNHEFDFQIDVCATKENTKCAAYIGQYRDEQADCQDALDSNTPWLYHHIRRAWCNPGFANPGPWMEKAFNVTQELQSVVVVLGLPSFSSKWWREWASRAVEIRLLSGRRLQFKPAPGIPKSSNARENCLFIFRRNSGMRPNIWTWDWTKELP